MPVFLISQWVPWEQSSAHNGVPNTQKATCWPTGSRKLRLWSRTMQGQVSALPSNYLTLSRFLPLVWACVPAFNEANLYLPYLPHWLLRGSKYMWKWFENRRVDIFLKCSEWVNGAGCVLEMGRLGVRTQPKKMASLFRNVTATESSLPLLSGCTF